MPARVQMTRRRPWRPEHPDAVIVARPSRWGNPFPTSEFGHDEAVRRFTAYMARRRDPPPGWVDEIGYPSDAEIRAELAGRDLACWCPPDRSCHADVLLAVANPE